jgi:hypothetical protein
VTLSRHTALHSDDLALTRTDFLWKKRLFLVAQLARDFPRRYVILFAPRPLEAFHHYYRMIRHLQVHRYFPFVVSLIGFLLASLADFPCSA